MDTNFEVGGFTFKVADKPVEEMSKNISKFEWRDLIQMDKSTGDYQSARAVQEKKKEKAKLLMGSPGVTNGIDIGSNSFVYTAMRAYNTHHNLILRPDDLWIAIVTQFSFYVNGKSEELRDTFVDFQGKKELVVFLPGNLATAPYDEAAILFCEQISKNIKDPSVREWVIPNFSTTSASDRVVASVSLMAVMKNYFDFKCCLCCGIPQVTLKGSVDDWKDLRKRADRLVEFEVKGSKLMSKWSKMLFPVLDEFIASASGHPNLDFWNKIVNVTGGGSGPSYLSGWITAFCVFGEKGEWRGDVSLLKSWPKIDTSDIPIGFVTVPVVVNDNKTEYNTEMYAGHMVANVSADRKTVSPSLDWCIISHGRK